MGSDGDGDDEDDGGGGLKTRALQILKIREPSFVVLEQSRVPKRLVRHSPFYIEP